MSTFWIYIQILVKTNQIYVKGTNASKLFFGTDLSTFQTYDKLKTIPLLEEAVPKNLCQTSPFSALGSWENGFSPLDLIFI